jgi:hypothetical protein
MAITPVTVGRVLAAVAALALLVFVVVKVTAPTVEPGHLLQYRLGETNYQIVVTVARGHCDKVKDTRAQEDATSVRVTALVERSRGTCTADIVFDAVPVALAAPLDGRAVFDAEGAPLRLESIVTGPCSVTAPLPTPLSPPPPTRTGPNPDVVFSAGPGSFLYGNDVLIVTLPSDGTLHPSDTSRGLSGGVKFPWWRIAHGALVIVTQRLDAMSVPLPADVPGGYGETGFQVSGLRFPSPGCWQVSGTIDGKTLTFVVNVAGT